MHWAQDRPTRPGGSCLYFSTSTPLRLIGISTHPATRNDCWRAPYRVTWSPDRGGGRRRKEYLHREREEYTEGQPDGDPASTRPYSRRGWDPVDRKKTGVEFQISKYPEETKRRTFGPPTAVPGAVIALSRHWSNPVASIIAIAWRRKFGAGISPRARRKRRDPV